MKKVNNFLLWFIAGTSLFILLFFGITISPTQAKDKPKPISSRLTLKASNIVTYELYKNRIRVWGNDGDGEGYSNIWTAEEVNYRSIAIGDIDGDGQEEIVGLGVCERVYGKGKNREKEYEIFINVYKEGQQGIWMTTYSDNENIIIEEKDTSYYEIVLNDIDGDNLNEIILMTRTYLTIYKYDNDTGILKKIASRQLSKDIPFDKDVGSFGLKSVTAGDIDRDGQKEIIAAGDLISTENKGCIFICNLPDSDTELNLKNTIYVEYNFSKNSLRAGDLDRDGYMELCASVYNMSGSYPNYNYASYLLIWDYVQEAFACEELELEDDEPYLPWNPLDVGNLDNDPTRDEIALVVGHSKQLLIYNWETSGFSNLYTIDLNPLTTIVDIAIGDSNSDGNNDINIAGNIYETIKRIRSSWIFYLAVYDVYREQLWEQVDSDGEDVFDIAVDNKI